MEMFYNPATTSQVESGQATIFVLPQELGIPLLPFLSHGGESQKSDKLFQYIAPNEFVGLFFAAQTALEADFLLLPHDWSLIRDKVQKQREYVNMALAAKKPLLLFAYQDSSEKIILPNEFKDEFKDFKNFVVFRPSLYRSQQNSNEICMPAYVEDVGKLYGQVQRHKSEKPTVGFIGKAGFESLSHRLRYLVKNTLLTRHPHKDGLLYRRRAMRELAKDTRINTRFVMRSSYGANRKTIPLDPDIARKEYITNLKECDLALCIKGNGNYSLRFFEAFSMGRIPLFIDTDSVLPLESELPYDSVLLRVPYNDMATLSDIVHAWFEKVSDEEFVSRQVHARTLFNEYLNMPAFLRHAFRKEFLTAHSMTHGK